MSSPLAVPPTPLPSDAGSARRDRAEIVRLLRRLAEERAPVLLVHGDDGSATHAHLVALTDGERSVVLDPADGALDHVLRCSTVSCQVALGHDRVHFTLEPKRGRYARRAVVRARVPELIVNVQRREYYRLDVGADDRVSCTVVLPQRAGRPVRTPVSVLDLSATGMAFAVPFGGGAQLRLHDDLGKCELDLAGLGACRPALRVRSLRKVIEADGSHVRVGAEFVGIGHRDVALVQRCLAAIARRRRDARADGSP
jgi:c-di-GMP-binding flagellar brake protein YcgR